MSNLHAQQQLSIAQKILILAGLTLLIFLAFFPLSHYIQTDYNDIILNSLHMPGVWFFYCLCIRCIRNTKATIAVVAASIFVVEIAQHSIGRQASWMDITQGFAGLWLGVKSTKINRIIVIGLWLSVCLIHLTLRYDVGTHFPNFGHFHITSIRNSWHPLRPKKDVTSHILYLKTNSTRDESSQALFARVTRTQQEYYGASFRVLKNKKIQDYSHVKLCIHTEFDDSILMRIDDKRQPEYKERINIQLTTSNRLECHNIPLIPEIQKMQENKVPFKIQNIRNISVFFKPEAPSRWFEIHNIQLINVNSEQNSNNRKPLAAKLN